MDVLGDLCQGVVDCHDLGEESIESVEVELAGTVAGSRVGIRVRLDEDGVDPGGDGGTREGGDQSSVASGRAALGARD